jgi:hypothetical protein
MDAASNSVTTPVPSRTHTADDADEMPLLFMDGLPSDFQRNAQLAALVTFMGSDDEETNENDDEDESLGRVSAARQRRNTRRTARQPYARSGDAEKISSVEDASEKKQNKSKKRSATAAQELSLYLSMFTVSKE